MDCYSIIEWLVSIKLPLSLYIPINKCIKSKSAGGRQPWHRNGKADIDTTEFWDLLSFDIWDLHANTGYHDV